MIVLNVSYITKDGMREEFYNAILPKAEVFRTEAGNIQYEYYKSVSNDNELLLVEKWENKETLDAHCSTEIFESLQAIKADMVEKVNLDRFEV